MKPNPTDGVRADLRVELSAGALRQILTGLGKRASRKKTSAACGCVRVSHDGSGSAEFCSTDSRTWHFARPPRSAAGATGATAVIPTAALRDAVKGLPAAARVVIRSEDSKLVFAHGSETRALPGRDRNGFPPPPVLAGTPEILPPAAKRALVEALRCASTDETRPVVGGVALDLSDRKSHHIVGTDGRHLYSANSFSLPVAESRVLGPSPLLLWDPFIRADAWKLRVCADPKDGSGAWEISSGIWRTVGRLIAGAYPGWRQVVPEAGAFRHRVQVPSAECASLADELRRLSVASDGRHQSVLVQGDGRHLHIRWRDAESRELRSLPVGAATVTGSPFRVALPRPELAKAIGFGLGELQVIDEISPIRLSDGKGRQMIIMPLRVAFPEEGKTPSAGVRPAPAVAEAKPRPAPAPAPAARRPAAASAKAAAPMESADSGPSLESAMEEIGRVRDTLRLAASGLQTAAGLVRQARQEQKSADREMRTVRSTLRSLTRLRF